MRTRRIRAVLASIALVALAAPLPGLAADAEGAVNEVFDQPISNIDGKSMIAVEVSYPPGGSSPAHYHESSGFIMAYVVSGAIRSQVEGEPERVFEAGETWYEKPGAHHVVSANASDTEPAKLLAVFVVDTDHDALTTFDTD